MFLLGVCGVILNCGFDSCISVEAVFCDCEIDERRSIHFRIKELNGESPINRK